MLHACNAHRGLADLVGIYIQGANSCQEAWMSTEISKYILHAKSMHVYRALQWQYIQAYM